MTYYNNYRQRCFEHHIKTCIICGENRVLEVHHIDKNRENNSPINLCPLCPNCHRLLHNKDQNIENKILEYQESFCDYYFNQEKY